ncbi:MAG: hypothetical protein U1G07_15630 [Verrucomicrobiota bacterium]
MPTPLQEASPLKVLWRPIEGRLGDLLVMNRDAKLGTNQQLLISFSRAVGDIRPSPASPKPIA